jgi:hypothetical protein
MGTYSENKIISLNSNYGIQQNGTLLSSILFNTGLILEEEESIIDSHISVINAQLPVSFYTITSSNNAISASFVGGFSTYLIPVGNYNSNTLITALQTLFGYANSITVTFNNLNGKFIFESATLTIFTFNFNITNSAYQILGFLKSTYTTNTSIITSPYPINLLGVKRISIKSNSFATSSFSSSGSDNTLCVIPCDVPSYNMISYQNSNNIDKQKIRVKTINQVGILIYDENNNLLDFNNIHWTLTLCLENLRIQPKPSLTFNEIISNNSGVLPPRDRFSRTESLKTESLNLGDNEFDLLTNS